tara:strand:+ start:882 stop:1064 length:183 start_codon:yes stop_codon:yes gene_type:complete
MNNRKINKKEDPITRKEALSKLGGYGKYAAFTALGTYLVLNPQKAQAQSTPGDGGGGLDF